MSKPLKREWALGLRVGAFLAGVARGYNIKALQYTLDGLIERLEKAGPVLRAKYRMSMDARGER